VRHVLNLRGVAWRNSRALRIMPHVVDSTLLASAIALMFITHQYPFVNSWLTVKLFALVAYIVLGSIALKYGRTPFGRRAAFLTAAAVFAFIISVARSHSPLAYSRSSDAASNMSAVAFDPIVGNCARVGQ